MSRLQYLLTLSDGTRAQICFSSQKFHFVVTKGGTRLATFTFLFKGYFKSVSFSGSPPFDLWCNVWTRDASGETLNPNKLPPPLFFMKSFLDGR